VGIRFWEVATGKRLTAPWPHAGRITEVQFSPDGKTVLTHCSDGKDRLWSVAAGELIGGPFRGSLCAEFSRDGKAVLLGSQEATARLWDVAGRQFIGQPLPHEETVLAAAFGPDGRTALTGSGKLLSFGGRGGARLWELPDRPAAGRVLKHRDEVRAAVFSPDSKTVLTACGHAPAGRFEVRLWEAAGGAPIGVPLPQSKWLSGVAFGPDGRTAVTAGGQGVQSWDTAVGKLLARPVADEVHQATFSADGKILLDRGRKTVVLFQVATGERIGEFHPPVPLDWIDAAALSSDGSTAVVAVDDFEVFFLDVAARKFTEQPLRHHQAITTLGLSPDGRTLLTGCADGTAQLWDVPTRTPRGPPFQHQAKVTALAFSPDGTIVATGSEDQTARLWDVATRRPIGPRLRHHGAVEIVAFSPDGRMVLSAAGPTARLGSAPAPVQGDRNRLTLWAQVVTGLELDDDGEVRLLDAPTWGERRQRLRQLGGPPMP
jgi:WD40 repeat protein